MSRRVFVIRLAVVIGVILVTVGLIVWKLKFDKPKVSKDSNVSIPSIVGGELVLPKVVDINLNQNKLTTGDALLQDQLWVLSANLVGIYNQSAQPAAPKFVVATDSASTEAARITEQPAPPSLSGIRILGQVYNPGKKMVTNFLPVVRFLDNDNNLKLQKIAHFSANYEFYGLDPGGKGVYDVTVDDPPVSDKIEVVLNPQEGDRSLRLPVSLKVASRSSEIQTVQAQNGENVDVYVVKGEVVNTTETSVADILVHAYVRDKDGKVFGLGKQDFKADLIRPGETIPFKIMVLPVRTDAVYDETVIEVWGREYRL